MLILIDFVEIRLIERAYYSVFATNKRKTRFLNAYLLLSKNVSVRLSVISVRQFVNNKNRGIFFTPHKKINTPKNMPQKIGLLLPLNRVYSDLLRVVRENDFLVFPLL